MRTNTTDSEKDIALITIGKVTNADETDSKLAATTYLKDPVPPPITAPNTLSRETIPKKVPILNSISSLEMNATRPDERKQGIVCHGEKKKLSESKVHIINNHSSSISRMYMKVTAELKNPNLLLLLIIFIIGMVAINVVLAALFLVYDEEDDEDDATCCQGSFEEALWLSIETFSTVGYGSRSAEDRWKHIVVIFNIVAGFFWYAIFGGIMYVKVVRGHVDDVVCWSPVLTICDIPHVTNPVLSFRTMNMCGHARKIYDFTIEMFFVSGESGHHFNMKLSGNYRVPVFTSIACVFHEIDETSPLWGITQESTKPGGKFCDSYIHVVIRGEDSRVSSYATADQVYMLGSSHEQCFFGRYFVPAFAGMETESLDQGTIGLKFCQVAFQSTFPVPVTFPKTWTDAQRGGPHEKSGSVSPRRFSDGPELPRIFLASHPSIRIKGSAGKKEK